MWVLGIEIVLFSDHVIFHERANTAIYNNWGAIRFCKRIWRGESNPTWNALQTLDRLCAAHWCSPGCISRPAFMNFYCCRQRWKGPLRESACFFLVSAPKALSLLFVLVSTTTPPHQLCALHFVSQLLTRTHTHTRDVIKQRQKNVCKNQVVNPKIYELRSTRLILWTGKVKQRNVNKGAGVRVEGINHFSNHRSCFQNINCCR